MPVARARSISTSPAFRSKLEKRAWERHYEWLPDHEDMLAMYYEPFVLHLTGGNYTPDFVVVYNDGRMIIIEVKGSWGAYKSGRSSKRNLKQAAVEFAWLAEFYALLPGGSGWDMQQFGE